jgi:DegV family protein with EDD domain
MNRINVFPVADGDTGNNIILTVSSIIKRLEISRSAGKTLEKIADLSLEGARGNSGLIVSQYLNGMARNSGEKPALSLPDFGTLVKQAVHDAYRAMESPAEGTILTVLRVWADTIHEESRQPISLKSLFSRGFAAAKKALEKTTQQLAVLREHKVVDAGAWGFVSFLEGIEKLAERGPVPHAFRKSFQSLELISSGQGEKGHGRARDLAYRYCTEVLLEHPEASAEELKDRLKAAGDSLIVSRGRTRTRIHIHTDKPAELVSILRGYGKIVQQKVDDMVRQEQVMHRRSSDIAVVTDSIADIPRDLLDRYQIHVLNLNLLWDEDEFLDRLTITPDEFYRQQSIRSSFPGSSIPERSRVDALFLYLMEHYRAVVALPVAKALSGTWRLLSLAAEPYNREEKRIEVVDTCLNSVAQGLLVVKVAKAASEGKSFEELIRLAGELRRQTRIYVSVNTFEFMVKGGRVSPLKGKIATLLNMKPIVSLDEEGRGIAFETSFSGRGLLRKIAALTERTAENRGIDEYAVVHAAARERAEEFAALVQGVTGRPPLYVTDISPIVGMHSGRGAVAIGIIESGTNAP